jgi:hypothetical protein
MNETTKKAAEYRRILEGVLRAQQVRTKLVPDELTTKAIAEGRGLELVRHLAALKRDGGRT